MYKLAALFFLAILTISVSAGTPSIIETTAYMTGASGISVHSTHQWNVGGNYAGENTMSNLQGGAAHTRITTGPGNTTYSKTTQLNASAANAFETSSDLTFDGGGVYSDAAGAYDYKVFIPRSSMSGSNADISAGAQNETSTQGQLPSHQEIHTSASGMGDVAHVTTDELINGIDYASDYRAEGGSGIYTVDIAADIEAGANPDEPTIDYRAKIREKYISAGDYRTGLSGSVSTYYRDFSRPLGFGDEASVEPLNTTANITEIEFSEPVASVD